MIVLQGHLHLILDVLPFSATRDGLNKTWHKATRDRRNSLPNNDNHNRERNTEIGWHLWNSRTSQMMMMDLIPLLIADTYRWHWVPCCISIQSNTHAMQSIHKVGTIFLYTLMQELWFQWILWIVSQISVHPFTKEDVLCRGNKKKLKTR